MPFPQVPLDGDDAERMPGGGRSSGLDGETRQLLAEVVEALEAVLIAAQVDPVAVDRKRSDYAFREAIRRVNRLRRVLRDHDVA